MASAVAFPESLLPQEKSRGHAPEKMLSWAKRHLPLCRTPERKMPFLQTNTLKNYAAKQGISADTVQKPIDNFLITLPSWDGY